MANKNGPLNNVHLKVCPILVVLNTSLVDYDFDLNIIKLIQLMV